LVTKRAIAFIQDESTDIYPTPKSSQSISFATGGREGASLHEPMKDDTALLIRRNSRGVSKLQPVIMGAPDSGGAGYRVLRIPH